MRLLQITGLITLLILVGCSTVSKYPPTAEWGPDVKLLGPIKADSGRWPLSLNVPPADQTYYSALKTAAAKQYGVAENSIVLSEVTVEFGTEMVGTIRSWRASAVAGQR